jgi:hypothetical protein
MGVKLDSYYNQAAKLGGFKAQMRLALLTCTPQTKARTIPDSSEQVQIFEKAMSELSKEFK